ncbi:MAG: hypothetical protein JWQ55_6566, partial [Rhodopila sp.]|nr:hypothetical protein [Rhodopila sp.]
MTDFVARHALWSAEQDRAAEHLTATAL